MNRKTRMFPHLLLTLGLGASLSFGSCSDNDLENGSNGGNHNGNDTTLVTQIDRHEALARLLGALADVDSLPDNWNQPNFTVPPTVGVVKDEAQPHVRYLVVPDAAEAYRTYCSYVGASSQGEAKNAEWRADSIGTLKFEVNNQADLYATLKVSVQQLPALEELRFVPASAIGSNLFKPDGMYYQFGDVVKQTKDDIATYYVCVRPCSKASELRQTHWVTLQTDGSNFKKISDELELPTQLSSKQDVGLRMVQNYFNVLRIADNPDLYVDESGLDKVTKKSDEFRDEHALRMRSLWEMADVWNNLTLQGNDTKLREAIQKLEKVRAYYYGYNSVWFGSGDYRVYQADLSNKDGGYGLFNKVETSTPWLNKRTETDGHTTKFSNITRSLNGNGVYIDSYGTDRFENTFVIKTVTGAELMGRSGIDPASDRSFSDSKNKAKYSGGVQKIEDIVVNRQDVYNSFYALGDVVTGAVPNDAANFICFLSNSGTNYNDNAISYFLMQPYYATKDETLNAKLDNEMAKRVLYQFYLACKYFDSSYPISYKDVSGKEMKLSQTEQKTFDYFLDNLYRNYLNGRVQVTNLNNRERSITACINDQCYELTVENNDKNTVSKFEALEDNPDPDEIKNLYVIAYPDQDGGIEEFSTNHKIVFNLKGIQQRKHLRLAHANDLETHFGAWGEE